MAISSAIEGVRPFLIETQALVSSAAYGTPQRSATGFDQRRLNMLLAVLEKRVGFKLMQKDVFLNIAGGLRVTDMAMDLSVIAAVLSSNVDTPIESGWCMAGEVGHTVIQRNGLPCPCGRHGCWEQYASATALKRMTAEALAAHPDSGLARVVAENDGHVSGQSAFIAAREGDPVGQAVCDRYVNYLACGVINVVNIFQPDTLAIGGGVSNEAEEQLLLPVQQRVARESIPCGKDRRTRIVKAQLGNRAGLIGAALLGKNKRI